MCENFLSAHEYMNDSMVGKRVMKYSILFYQNYVSAWYRHPGDIQHKRKQNSICHRVLMSIQLSAMGELHFRAKEPR